MILIGQYDSPFVRRVAISLRVLGFSHKHDARSVFADFDAMEVGRVATMGICLCVRSDKGRRAGEGCPRLPGALGGLRVMRVLGGHGKGRSRACRFGRIGGFGFEPGDDVGDREGLVEPVHDEADVIAAVFIDGAVQFVPQWMARRDAEIAADVSEDGADRLTPDLGRDLLWGRQVGETGIRVGGLLRLGAPRGRWSGLAREGAGCARGWCGFRLGFGVEAGGGAGDLFWSRPARSRPCVMRARIRMRSLVPKVRATSVVSLGTA
jgi:hypothetical protein